MKNDVFTDSDVQFTWCLTGVSLEISQDRVEDLLEMCIEKWITICDRLCENPPCSRANFDSFLEI